MEYIIGRDQATSQLKISAGQQSARLGAPGSVPMTVSRQHCAITTDGHGHYAIRNLKPQNVTYVNGLAVESKHVGKSDSVALGPERYLVDMKSVFAFIDKVEPKYVDIRHLRQVWDDYKKQGLEMTVAERRFNALRSATGLVTMVAIVLALTVGHSPLYFALYGLAIVLTAGFAIKAYINSTKIPQQREELNDWFRHEYVCPNCGRHFNMNYEDLAQYDACPWCKAKFKK